MKERITRLILVIVGSVSAWNYNKGGTNWGGACAATTGQSPINIDQPFTYEGNLQFKVVPDISFNYNTVAGMPLINNGNNLIMEADFGFMMYKGEIYNSQNLVMLAPSEHSFGPLNTRYAMELQITHTNAQGQDLVVSVLFSTSLDEAGLFLNALGFDSPDMKKLAVNEQYPLKDVVDLQGLINNSQRYLAYQGSTTRPPCSPNTTWIIIADTIKASKLQVGNFPQTLRQHTRELEPRGGRTIRTSVENILKQPGSANTQSTKPAGPLANKFQIMMALYRDYLVIQSQVNLNSTASIELQKEQPIIDTDFPNYGKKTIIPEPTGQPATTSSSTTQTLAQEPLSADEKQALKQHMNHELKSELFNSPPKQAADTMRDGTKSEKMKPDNGEGETGQDFVDKFINEEPQVKQGTALFQLHSTEVILSRENVNALTNLIELASNGVKISPRAIDYFDTSAWPSACKTGLLQSPINVQKPYYPDPYPLSLKFQNPSSNLYLLMNDGYNVKVQADFGKLEYGSHKFQTYELILHQPSEHTVRNLLNPQFGIEQKSYDFEVQVISKDSAGTILGIILLFQTGTTPSSFLDALGLGDPATVPRVQQPGAQVKYTGGSINMSNVREAQAQIFSQVVNYITYYGSLSSPPCTEGVQWAIAEQVFSITMSQINAFKIMSGRASNVRRTQESNGRLITQI